MTAPPELPLVALERPESLADRTYRVVRAQIASGGMRPGQRLTERGLAAQLEVSPTPVREALRRLEQDRLVERLGPREMRVVEHSADTLKEIGDAEAVLSALIARIAADKINEDVLDRMDALYAALQAGADTATAAQLLELSRQFDDELSAAADSPFLQGLIETLSVFGRAHRTRSVQTLRDANPAEARRRIELHGEILAALRARNLDRVEQVVRRQHLEAMDYLMPH